MLRLLINLKDKFVAIYIATVCSFINDKRLRHVVIIYFADNKVQVTSVITYTQYSV